MIQFLLILFNGSKDYDLVNLCLNLVKNNGIKMKNKTDTSKLKDK